MEKATDNFNELGVLGEGRFGRVYSRTLEDGTKVAVKVLKCDNSVGFGIEMFDFQKSNIYNWSEIFVD